MKLNIKYIIGVAAVATLGMVSCTDEIKFGNAFLEKALGGTVTADEVFSNPEYTRNFLASIYSVLQSAHQFHERCSAVPELLERNARCVGG